jgi:SEC-C motif
MKVGRNDPCPCGSGKKYKKCCLAKDEAAQRVAARAFQPPPLPPPPPPSPLEQAQSKLWQEFEATKRAEQPALFRRALAEGEVLDAEYAFEMLCAIRDHHDRVIFADALDALRAQRPELYQHDASYYLDWQIADALATGDLSSLPALGLALAATAGKDLDSFYDTLERLMYHGQLDLIAQMMLVAWAYVRTSDKFVPGADDEFAFQAMDLTLFARLEQNPDLRPDDPELIGALEAFAEIEPQQLSSLLELLAAQPERRWTLDDFAFQPPRRREEWYDEDEDETDPAVAQLHDLTFTFLGTLHREQGISLAKGDLVRKSIERYILERHAGELEPSDTPWEALRRPKGRKTPSVVRQRQPAHPLCPDRATLDRFIAEMFGFMSAHYYQAAATLELVPAWLKFLEGRGLLTAEQRASALADLRRLVAEAAPIWQDRISDPAPGRNIQLAWESA